MLTSKFLKQGNFTLPFKGIFSRNYYFDSYIEEFWYCGFHVFSYDGGDYIVQIPEILSTKASGLLTYYVIHSITYPFYTGRKKFILFIHCDNSRIFKHIEDLIMKYKECLLHEKIDVQRVSSPLLY